MQVRAAGQHLGDAGFEGVGIKIRDREQEHYTSGMDYVESLRWLLTLPDFERTGEFEARPDVAPMRALLWHLGDPQVGRPTMHIAGSKGKGSTAAMAEAILRAAGDSTGCYISPHLHRYNERIRIDGAAIDREGFAAAMTAVREGMDAVAGQFRERAFVAFDALTAAAFVAFRERGVEAQVVEVGLGGALDSTNVFDATDVVVVTPVSLEHTAILGDTIAAIAAQKAGIITRGATVVVAPQRESALDVIRATAAERGAEAVAVAEVCQMSRTAAMGESQEFKLKTARASYALTLPLLGRHQLDNAATAVVACEELMRRRGRGLDPSHVQRGLAGVSWPGRLEVLKRRPLVVVDGAHNADSAKRLAIALREHFGLTQAVIIAGTLAGKDIDGMAAAMAVTASEVYAPAWPHARAADARAVAAAFAAEGVPATAFGGLGTALDAAESQAGERGAVVAFGSIAFVAAVREYLLGIESDMIMMASQRDRSAP